MSIELLMTITPAVRYYRKNESILASQSPSVGYFKATG